jgi:hypothetical protein
LKSDAQGTETEAEAGAAEVDDALRLVGEETVDRVLDTENDDDDRMTELETLAETEDDTDLTEDEVLEEDDDPDREIDLD